MTGEGMAGSPKAAFSAVAAVLYLVMGVLQAIAGAGLDGRWSEALGLGGGVPDGLVLVLVGAVFLQGRRELARGMTEGVAFVYMGIVMAVAFMGLELAGIGASYLGEGLIGGPDYVAPSLHEALNPILYLSPMPILGLWWWRSGFSLIPRGTPGNGAKDLNNEKEGVS